MLTFLLWIVLLCGIGIVIIAVADKVEPWLFPDDDLDDTVVE